MHVVDGRADEHVTIVDEYDEAACVEYREVVFEVQQVQAGLRTGSRSRVN